MSEKVSYKENYRALLLAYATRRYTEMESADADDQAAILIEMYRDPFMIQAIREGIWSPPSLPGK